MPSHLSSSGSGGGGSYTLPVASSSVLGGVKVGSGLAIDGSGVLSAAPALVKLAEIVLSGTQATLAFSSIPGAYRSLELIVQARGDATASSVTMALQFNGDTDTNYDWVELYGFNTSVSSDGAAAASSIAIGGCCAATAPAGAAGCLEILIPNYAGTTFQKAVLSRLVQNRSTAFSGQLIDGVGGTWRSTAAITSILLSAASGSFIAGTTASLYAWL